MKQYKKDIFGNLIEIQTPTRQLKPMSYTQKLREAKAKERYRQYQINKAKQQVQLLKQAATKTSMLSKKGLQKTKTLIKTTKERTQKTRSAKGLLQKIRSFRKNSIYDKE